MKLSECKRCSLCNNRLRLSIGKGIDETNVFIVFGKEPTKEVGKNQLRLFIDSLRKYLEWDYHYDFAIKCYSDSKVNDEHINKCRIWVNNKIKKVQPYLIILMGRVACKSVLGLNHGNLLEGIFYTNKDEAGKRKQYYVGCNINSHPAIVEKHIQKIALYIKENYG